MNSLQNLSTIFSKKIFHIPDYQRGYAWTDDHRNDLIEDIEDILRLRTLKKNHMHFTGTIVAKKLPEKLSCKGESFDQYDIVDGQQRLTTLNIFLNEISATYANLGGNDNTDTARNLRKNFIEIQENIHFRLNLNTTLGGFYTSKILKDSTLHTTQQAEKNLLEAKQLFRGYLINKKQEQDESEFHKFLNELRETITDYLGFVWYEVADDHEVSVIFETMNSRGKDLTQFEKVKNILFYLVGRNADEESANNLSKKINDTWSTVLTTLAGAPGTDEDQFLRFFWAIFPGAKWFDEGQYENQNDRASDVHKGIKETAKKDTFKENPVQWINDFLDGIKEYSPIYRDIQSPTTHGSFPFSRTQRQEFIELCSSIDRIGRDANLIPLLMATYKNFQNIPEDLKEIFRLVEVFSFRLLLQGRYASTGRSKAFSLAADIASAKVQKIASVKEKIKNDLINTYCTDNQFEARLKDATLNFYDWRGINYFLFEYEKHLSKENALPLNWEELLRKGKEKSIEHILPQGENTLENKCWSTNFTKSEWEENVNRLGNLVLADPRWNSSYGNKCFVAKQGKNSSHVDRVYKNSMSQSEKELLDYNDWTVESIESRQSKLAKFALNRWKQ
jgi:uncharacterized protein with ParB-like and HNH nuclease domain